MTCGLAITVRSTGIVLWPVIAYLMYVQFRDDWREQCSRLLVLALVIAVAGRLVTGALITIGALVVAELPVCESG